MSITRLLVLTILFPIWFPLFLVVGVIGLGVFVPIWFALAIIGLLEYAFAGDDDMLKTIFGSFKHI